MARTQTRQTNRRAKGDNQKRDRSIRQGGETPNRPGPMGGQGMGQGRGMNAGEVHQQRDQDKDDDR